MSLTWNYTLAADEQTASQTFFKVAWRKFNLEFASFIKFTGSNPLFNEPNSPRIVIDRSIGDSSATLQFVDVRLEDEGIYKIEVSVTFPGTATIAEQEFNLTVLGKLPQTCPGMKLTTACRLILNTYIILCLPI